MKKMKRIVSLLLCLAMVLVLFAGCSSEDKDTQKDNDAQQSEEGYPFTLDNYGRQVEITKRPQKVLTLGPNCTELFAALGLSDLVVGRSLVNHRICRRRKRYPRAQPRISYPRGDNLVGRRLYLRTRLGDKRGRLQYRRGRAVRHDGVCRRGDDSRRALSGDPRYRQNIRH